VGERPERGHATLADGFQRVAERGHLRLDDPLLAAQRFNWLVLSVPLNTAMFPGEVTFTPSDLERVPTTASASSSPHTGPIGRTMSDEPGVSPFS
jgi:AefR-like transcriptional repressor, C-terminal domain